MKLKNILILILCIVLCPPIVMAVSDNTVYTEFTGGNSSSTGNGTEQSPYNLFEDALNAVEDGGTICVGEKGAFVNSSDDKPLVINKNVTITSKSDTAPEISIRKAGVVLGGNVSFKNVVLSLVNGNHALIAANGYTLTLDNVTYFQNTREVHIVGGTLYDKNGVSLSLTVGEKSKIVLSGNKTHFGNIYAGSINGSFDKDVEIDINGVTGKNIGKVYSCGAKEGYYNSDNFLDPNNEPTAPTADSAVYGVTGNVNINLSNSSICEIDGDCGSGRANVSVVTEYQYSSAMKNIGLLTVDSGILELTEINDDVNVKINSNGILDMSNLGECSVNDFYGGGTLVLAKDGLLTVNGTLSSVTEFQTSGGVNSSGIAEYDRLYIKTSKGDGSFTFNPYATQSDMTLDKTVDGFKTSSKTEEAVVLKSFGITGSEFNDTSLEVNQGYFEIPIETEFEGSGFYDISMVPLVYTVSYNGKTYGPRNSTLTEDGNYEGDFEELNMCFAPITDNISVSKYSSTIGYMYDIAEGVYDVTVTAPTASGNVERSFKLIVGVVTPTATPTAVVPTPTANPAAGASKPTPKPTVAPEFESSEFKYDGLDQSWIDKNIDPEKPVVALSFDDGPGGYSEFVDYGMQIQKALTAAGAHATFFYIGAHIKHDEESRNEVLAAKEAGFEVANHSYDSNGLNSVGPEVIKEKIAKTDELLSEITGYKHFLFRAPNVAYSQAMYAVIEKPFIDVSIWSQDYQNSTTKDNLVNNVINNLKDGGIINMHSVHEKTAQAVPEILEQCKDKGYQVVSVSELFAIKGKKLMTGVKYNNAE